jgi:WD40 repeat protein
MFRAVVVVSLFTAGIASAAPPVSAVAYSPDGKRLAAGTRGVVHLVDPASGEITAELPGQVQRVTAVAFSADRLAVASGEPGKSGVLKLYTLGDPAKPMVEFVAHKDVIYALAFSPDGKTLATAGYDRVIKLWDVASPKEPRHTLKDHSDAVYALAWHKDGKLLASGAADRAVKVWDATAGKRLYTLGDATDWVYAVAWSPDGQHLAAGGVDKSVRVWAATADGGTLVHAAFAHSAAVSKVLFPADPTTLFTVGEDRVVKKWDAAKLVETKTYPTRPEAILAAAVRPDGKQLALGRFDGTLELFDPDAGRVTHTPLPPKPTPPVLTRVTPDAVRRGQTVRVTLEGQRLDQVTSIRLDPDGVGATIDRSTRTASRLEIDLTVAPSAAVGPLPLRVISGVGQSNELNLFVDRFPVVRETARSDSAGTAANVTLPATVLGSIDRAGDTDYFRFTATAGQQVGVQATAHDPKKLEPTLVLTDDAGTVLAESFNGLLGVTVPKAGTYAVGVADKEFRGGAGFEYRLHVGHIPIVTGVFPLGIQRGRASTVHIDGVNLGSPHGRAVTVNVPSSDKIGSQIKIPLAAVNGEKPLGPAEVVVGEFPASVATADGGEVKVPGTADGILSAPGQAQAVRFAAKKGEKLVVEVHAARLGSPLDSHVEILTADGKPAHRATLRCVAQTFVTFRDHDADKPGIRLDTWNELRTNDYLYVGTELMRIKELPRNPDDDCQFVQVDGKRIGFLGTTPTHHPQNAPMYKVEVHPPHTTFPPNGMPVFPLAYRNDDGGPGFGKDSMLEFDPPESGTYQVRVSDARGFGGPNFAYRLTVRSPKPDFTIRVTPNAPQVWKNGGVPVTVTATRIDGYAGPIAVRFDGLTAPFRIPATVIEAEQTTAVVTLFADGDKADKPGPLKAVATATIDGREIIREAAAGTPALRDPGDLTTTTSAAEVTVRPGRETKLTVKIDRRGDFKGRVPLEVRGLPHGVKVLNIGLNGILVMPDQTEREIVIYAEPWVTPKQVPIVVSSRSERRNTEHAARSVLLKVER